MASVDPWIVVYTLASQLVERDELAKGNSTGKERGGSVMLVVPVVPEHLVHEACGEMGVGVLADVEGEEAESDTGRWTEVHGP